MLLLQKMAQLHSTTCLQMYPLHALKFCYNFKNMLIKYCKTLKGGIFMKKKLSILLVVSIIAALILSGCGASAPKEESAMDMMAGTSSNGWFDGDYGFSSDSSFDNGMSVAPQAPAEKPESSVESSTTTGTINENYKERKIVYHVNTELQTKDLDGALEFIKKNISDCGGYIESEELSNNGSINYKYQHRRSHLEIRIPSKNLEKFLLGLEHENLYTISLYKDSQDYSEAYYDKETRIANLKIQETRLLELLEGASDIKTMLEIEERLSDIRYSIESLTKDMNIIDSRVEYSTVTLSLSEVVDYSEIKEEPVSFFEEVKEAIKDSWEDFVEACQDFVIWLIYAIPALVIWAIILVVICTVVRKVRKKKHSKKTPKTKPQDNDAE